MNCDKDPRKRAVEEVKESIRRGISTHPDYFWRQVYFQRHKHRLQEIDEAPPTLHGIQIPTTYVVNRQKDTFDRAQYLQSKIDRDNALLLADMHKIYSRKYEFNENMQNITNMNWKQRMLRTLRIGLENCEIYNRLQEIKPVVPTREDYYRWHKEMCEYRLRASRFPPYWESRLCAPIEQVAWARGKTVPKPLVYLDFEVLHKIIGRVVFELRADLVPITAENFRCLCTGARGRSYKCTEITSILGGVFWQGGAGITSIYGDGFENENYKMKHDAEGIISMVSYGEKTNNSEFRISAAPLPPMDRKQVAFGKVIMGMKFLNEMSHIAGLTEAKKPKTKIIITGGGEATEQVLMDLDPPHTLLEKHVFAELDQIETEDRAEEAARRATINKARKSKVN